MAGKISDLTRISGLDRANDLFEVDDVSLGASKSATVNDMLGLTSAPLGTTETQSPTNKTFDNTNTVTVKDTLFTLQDDGDTTKQAKFQLSGITTGTTRTYTLPNASGTLVDLASAQTLTNKTLTSPTLTTPTINNPTLNTDAISEFTGSNGVTVSGLNIKSGKLNTNNSVITANITDAAVTPAKLVAGTGAGWAWSSWTPTWTNFTPGNATTVYKYIQVGKTVHFVLTVVLGNTSVMGTAPIFTLPVAASSDFNLTFIPFGQLIMEQTGTGSFFGSVVINSTTIGQLTAWASAGANVGSDTPITATVPFTWGTGHKIKATGTYEAA